MFRKVTHTMEWADAHGVGYMAWTWDTWGDCDSLITDFEGTPNDEYGAGVRSHLLSRP